MGGHFALGRGFINLDAHTVLAGRVLLVCHVVAVHVVLVLAVALTVDGEGAVVVHHTLPVVVLGRAGGGHIVAVDIVAAGHADECVGGGVARGAHGHLCYACLVLRGRTGFVVVVHHVDVSAAGTAVAAARAPVVQHAVAEVHNLGLHIVVPMIGVVFRVVLITAPLVAGTVEARCAVLHVEQEVVVEGGQFAAPDAAVAVGTLVVSGVGEALCYGAPLHGEVVVVVEGGHLVDAPAEGAVVYQDAVFLALPDGVGPVVHILFLSAPYAYEADDVVGARAYGAVAQRDAGVGGCLSGYGGVAADGEVALQGDDTGHIEDDDFLRRAVDGRTE